MTPLVREPPGIVTIAGHKVTVRRNPPGWSVICVSAGYSGDFETRGRALAGARDHIRWLEELPRLRPLHGNVLVRVLMDETLAHFSFMAIAGGRTPPYQFAEVMFPGDHAEHLHEGDIVVVQAMAAVFGGTGVVDPEEYGFEPGLTAFVYCRVPPSPQRDAEVFKRHADLKAAEAELRKISEAGEVGAKKSPDPAHVEHLERVIRDNLTAIGDILKARENQGRSRYKKPINDPALADGIIAYVDGDLDYSNPLQKIVVVPSLH